jgi:hypothetical protein
MISLERSMVSILGKVGLSQYADISRDSIAERMSHMAFWGFDAHLKFFNVNYIAA